MKKPDYPGGDRGMVEFIKQNLRYPEDAMKHRIEGIVRIRITIDHRGKVTQTRIIDHLAHGCDEEADRVVRLLQFRVPNNRGVRATFNKVLNIHFQMPEALRPIGGIQYNYVGNDPVSEKKEEVRSGTYTVTIRKA